MDKQMMAKIMLRDFMVKETWKDRTLICPFIEYRINDINDIYHHDLCAMLFPRWAKKHMTKNGINYDGNCPCMVMSQSYVRRKARAFIKKK